MTQIRNVRFPLTQPRSIVLRGLKRALGHCVGVLRPGRLRRLENGPIPDHLNVLDRAMIAMLVSKHERAGTLGKLVGLHQNFWASLAAVSFHAQAEQRFQEWWLGRHAALVAPLKAAIIRGAGRFTTLCEIGAGSGLVLEDLSKRLPEVAAFIGLDLSLQQTLVNRARFPSTALQFEAGEATAWIPRNARSGWIFVTVAGVLEYLSQDQLTTLLVHIATELHPALFALAEPIAEHVDLVRDTQSLAYGLERSMSHCYPHLFEHAGWEVIFQDEQRVGGGRYLLLVARCGEVGSVRSR